MTVQELTVKDDDDKNACCRAIPREGNGMERNAANDIERCFNVKHLSFLAHFTAPLSLRTCVNELKLRLSTMMWKFDV